MTKLLEEYRPVHDKIISILSNNPNTKVKIIFGKRGIYDRYYRITIKSKTKSFWDIFKPKTELTFKLDIYMKRIEGVSITGCNNPSGDDGYYITQYLPVEEYVPLLKSLIENYSTINWIESERVKCIMNGLNKL